MTDRKNFHKDRAALAPLGEDLAAVHAEVRAVAKTLKTGAIPA